MVFVGDMIEDFGLIWWVWCWLLECLICWCLLWLKVVGNLMRCWFLIGLLLLLLFLLNCVLVCWLWWWLIFGFNVWWFWNLLLIWKCCLLMMMLFECGFDCGFILLSLVVGCGLMICGLWLLWYCECCWLLFRMMILLFLMVWLVWRLFGFDLVVMCFLCCCLYL